MLGVVGDEAGGMGREGFRGRGEQGQHEGGRRRAQPGRTRQAPQPDEQHAAAGLGQDDHG